MPGRRVRRPPRCLPSPTDAPSSSPAQPSQVQRQKESSPPETKEVLVKAAPRRVSVRSSSSARPKMTAATPASLPAPAAVRLLPLLPLSPKDVQRRRRTAPRAKRRARSCRRSPTRRRPQVSTSLRRRTGAVGVGSPCRFWRAFRRSRHGRISTAARRGVKNRAGATRIRRGIVSRSVGLTEVHEGIAV